MQVDTILQSKGPAVHTVPTTATVAEAIKTLNDRRIGAVVVVDAKGGVAGILSERDVVRNLGGDPAKLLAAPVSTIMTSTVITCARDTGVSELMEQMTPSRAVDARHPQNPGRKTPLLRRFEEQTLRVDQQASGRRSRLGLR